ncbi:MAG: ATP-binding protein [Candidatus Electronema sp. V4]|uniref:ATP-binding protein n=1 Tax=Candidatus Electronema sp. V4 TaxID=3454756 RepID=UPI0040558CEA
MPKIIALAGKGGTGKTTTAALLLKYLTARKMTPALAVDADSNANLNELLNVDVRTTLGKIRKDLKGDIPPGMSRDQYMEMKLHQSLIEEEGFDLMVMGQPDGPGCYCAANQYLAMSMDRLADNYKYIIVDNEAGMEHLSRLNLRRIDYLLIVSDPSARGILTARRIADLTGPLQLDIQQQYLLVNRAPDPIPSALQEKIDAAVTESGLLLAGFIPASDELVRQELSGASYIELPDDSKAVQQAFMIFDLIFGC